MNYTFEHWSIYWIQVDSGEEATQGQEDNKFETAFINYKSY